MCILIFYKFSQFCIKIRTIGIILIKEAVISDFISNF